MEPRKPEVQEIEMTPSEWAKLTSHLPATAPPPAASRGDEGAPDGPGPAGGRA